MLHSLLLKHFGYSSFNKGQEDAINHLLAGNHTLVVMPTGAGKSLIYQLASLRLPGVTVVISPLIALMKDQVDSLTRRGIPATFINSSISSGEQAARLKKLASGEYRIIYIAPERLRNAFFMRVLAQQPISLLAIDEAHCISEWGHDFRPDYLHISQARTLLGSPLTAALTATATPEVQMDILHQLGLSGETKRIITGFNRTNLTLQVMWTSGANAKFKALGRLIQAHKSGAMIIYTGTRRDAEDVAEYVRQVSGAKAEHYHAGLANEVRAEIQEDFITGKLNIICATNAFGMGIDRPDVRTVVHFNMPGSLEAYYQEAGRAGRDGSPAKAVLIYDPRDRSLHDYFIQSGMVTPADLREIFNALEDGERSWLTLDDLSGKTGLQPTRIRVGLAKLEQAGSLRHFSDAGFRMLLQRGEWNAQKIQKIAESADRHVRYQQSQLDKMVRYAESNACRRQIILDHFGDKGPRDAAQCCDNCINGSAQRSSEPSVSWLRTWTKPTTNVDRTRAKSKDLDEIQQLIIECVQSLPGKLPRSSVAKLLVGSHSERMESYQNHPLFGCLGDYLRSEVLAVVDDLIAAGILIKGEKGYLEPKTPTAPKQPVPRPAKPASTNRPVQFGDAKSPANVTELIDALNSENGNVRRLAASALGKIRDVRAVVPLIELLAHERKPQVRQYIVKALGSIGDRRAAGILQQVADDETEMYYTRLTASTALKHLKQ